MDLTLSGDFAKHLLSMTKKDKKLAEAMARQFLHSIESSSLAAYLLSADIATALLADRIMSNPEKTLQDLQSLPSAEEPVDGRRTRDRVAVSKRAPKKAAGRTAKRGPRRRHRLTPEEITKIKQQIRSFLAKHPWSTRKELATAISFPTVAAYNRIMNELKNEKVIVAQGEKSKTLYALQGAGKKSAAKTKAAGGKRAKSTSKAKARGSKGTASKKTKSAAAKGSKRPQTKKAAPATASEPTA